MSVILELPGQVGRPLNSGMTFPTSPRSASLRIDRHSMETPPPQMTRRALVLVCP